MIYYISTVLLWPIAVFVDFFLKIKHLYRKDHSVRILNYHSIRSDMKTRGFGHSSISGRVFSAQMKYLKEKNYNVIDLDDFIQWKENGRPIPPKTVILTFDDGFADNYVNAFPIISRYSFRAVLSVITEYVDGATPFPWLIQDPLKNRDRRQTGLPLSRTQIKAMRQFGMTIASHARSHRNLSGLDKNEVKEEIFGSKKDLENMLGETVKYFTYPYGSWGDFDNEDKKIVESAGYRAALSTKVGRNDMKSDLYELFRIPIYNRDGLSNFKRKLNGAYDFTGFFQYIGYRLKKKIVSLHQK